MSIKYRKIKYFFIIFNRYDDKSSIKFFPLYIRMKFIHELNKRFKCNIIRLNNKIFARRSIFLAIELRNDSLSSTGHCSKSSVTIVLLISDERVN